MIKGLIRSSLARFGYDLVPRRTIAMDGRQMRHFLVLADLYKRIEEVPGAVVECGVGRGRSLLQFAFLIRKEGKKRTLWGFDSFQGFPEPAVEDDSPRVPKAGEWSGTSPDDIRTVLRVAGIEPAFIDSSVHLVPGFFKDTLSKYDGKPIAFLHVDADLYESYQDVLTTLVPFVSKGGIVLFDEYGEDLWPGATQATDEFLADKPWKLERESGFGKYYFFVKS